MDLTRTIEMLKQAKHSVFLLRKSAKALPDTARRAYAQRRPFQLDERRYRMGDDPLNFSRHRSSTFGVNHVLLSRTADGGGPRGEIPPVMFCFWTGTNELTPPRMRSLQVLRAANPDLEVRLITPKDLPAYVTPEAPLHPAYRHLSLIHRSDYLRAYFMHHHGGVYCDLKEMRQPWGPLLDRANADPHVWACGPAEPRSGSSAPLPGVFGRDQRTHFSRILFQAAFAFKPGSPWTQAWLDEVERRLSYFSDLLKAYPARDPFGETGGYPVPWYALLAEVAAPLSLVYADHALIDDSYHYTYGPEGHR